MPAAAALFCQKKQQSMNLPMDPHTHVVTQEYPAGRQYLLSAALSVFSVLVFLLVVLVCVSLKIVVQEAIESRAGFQHHYYQQVLLHQ